MDYGHWDITQFGEFDPNEFFGFIYEIEEIATGRRYIGKKFFRHKRKKTKADRSKTKESDWREYTSSCVPLQESIELQGKDKFTFRMISLCSGRCQLTYEENQIQFARDVLRSRLPNGERMYFNKTIGHLLFAGVETQTEATKAKMSATRMGYIPTAETRAKMSASQTGKKLTQKTKDKLSLTNIGKKLTPETRRKMSLAYWVKEIY